MKQQKGQTWRSVNWQDAAAIRRLLQSGADPNEPLSIGMRPLHRAVRASHDASEKKIVQMLLQRGADPSITDEEGITPLVLAARMNNVGAVRALVERWRNHDDMNRALHMAARYGHHEIVMILLQNGADPNQPLQGMRPLHRAVRASHDASEEIVRMLLEAGADPSITDEEGITPLVLAARMNNVGAVRALVERWRNHDDMNRALHMAARYGHHEIVMILLENGADVNHRSGSWATPLHESSERAYTDTIRLLLDRGADTRLRNRAGETALHIAAGYDILDSVRLLLERGADPNARTHTGRTPLHETVENRLDREAVDLLLSYDADPYLRDQFGRTAFTRGSDDVQLAFLEHGYIPLPEEMEYIQTQDVAALAQARIQQIQQAQQRFQLVERGGAKQQQSAVGLAGRLPHELFRDLLRYGVRSLPRDNQESVRFNQWCRKRLAQTKDETIRARLQEQAKTPLTRARWLEQFRYQQKRQSSKKQS